MNGLNGLRASFRKLTNSVSKGLFSEEIKINAKSALTRGLSVSYEVLSSQQVRMLVAIGLMIIVCSSESFAAFQTASKDLKTVIKDFQKFLYDDVRFALCVIGFAFGGFGLIFSKNPDTRKQAIFVILGAAFFAFAPGILKFISEQTGTTNPNAN